MTQSELDNWVARISYKPGWELRAKLAFHSSSLKITVSFTGPSSVQGEEKLSRVIAHSRLMMVDDNFDSFVSEVVQAFHELENHETREFFKVDGKQWLVPHNSRAIYLVI